MLIYPTSFFSLTERSAEKKTAICPTQKDLQVCRNKTPYKKCVVAVSISLSRTMLPPKGTPSCYLLCSCRFVFQHEMSLPRCSGKLLVSQHTSAVSHCSGCSLAGVMHYRICFTRDASEKHYTCQLFLKTFVTSQLCNLVLCKAKYLCKLISSSCCTVLSSMKSWNVSAKSERGLCLRYSAGLGTQQQKL